jgi:hypothetical protein
MLDPSGPFTTRQCLSAGGFCAIHLASSVLQDYSSKPDLSIRKSHHNIVEFIKPVSLQCRLNLALGSELQDVDEVRRVIVRRADVRQVFAEDVFEPTDSFDATLPGCRIWWTGLTLWEKEII